MVSRPARSAPRMVPPPTRGASKSNSAGVTASELVVVVGGVVAAGEIAGTVRLVVGAGSAVVCFPPQAKASTHNAVASRPAVGSRCMSQRYDRYGQMW